MDTDINEIVSKIRKLKSLKPSTEVNKVFSKLVSIALSSKAKINLGSNDINFIQRSAAIAEYELEKYWVKRIIKGINGLEEFPYYVNYLRLTRLEWHTYFPVSITKVTMFYSSVVVHYL